MSIFKFCENQKCGKQYSMRPDKAKIQKYCCHTCSISVTTKHGREMKACEFCSKEFLSVERADGRWPKFCSLTCLHGSRAASANRKERVCPNCNISFLAGRTKAQNGYQIYCCETCRWEHTKSGKELRCVNCGIAFYRPGSEIKARENSKSGMTGCCSEKCQAEYYTGTRAGGYKTGTTFSPKLGKLVLMKRPGVVSRYFPEHRLIASREIGRILDKREIVLRVNQDKQDNRPENLYICDVTAYNKIRFGTLPWPTKSNLNTYEITRRNNKNETNPEVLQLQNVP